MNRMVITAAARTPITGWRRAQSGVNAEQLAAQTFAALGAEPGMVLLGNTVGAQGNPARKAALAAGWGTAGALTLDAQCGSSLAAIGLAAAHAQATGQTVVAGGTESPSTVWPTGQRTQATFTPEGFEDPDMSWAADELAHRYGISRWQQETYAATSHARALQHPGDESDDGPRNAEPLIGRLTTITKHRHPTVTALSAARIADGAAALRIEPEPTGPHLGVEIVDYRLVGATPELPGLGAAHAMEAIFQAHRLTVADIAVIDIVEAYAPQVLAVCQRLDLNPHRVNAYGGALAHGHPWAASGAIATLATIEQLRTSPPGTLGVTAAAIAGGQGAALLLRSI